MRLARRPLQQVTRHRRRGSGTTTTGSITLRWSSRLARLAMRPPCCGRFRLDTSTRVIRWTRAETHSLYWTTHISTMKTLLAPSFSETVFLPPVTGSITFHPTPREIRPCRSLATASIGAITCSRWRMQAPLLFSSVLVLGRVRKEHLAATRWLEIQRMDTGGLPRSNGTLRTSFRSPMKMVANKVVHPAPTISMLMTWLTSTMC